MRTECYPNLRKLLEAHPQTAQTRYRALLRCLNESEQNRPSAEELVHELNRIANRLFPRFSIITVIGFDFI